ncbi:hypothetical protein Tco_1029086 [Tanacetum coccineum]|uniref:Uncharacterized protein n=1 Tax=Tanacetum coccineum TaxID=301880 RepID=A0ABQ5G2H1_9ASTR
MDVFTKRALWDYWKIGGDEIEVSDDESFDLEEYWSDKEETGEIFKIETDVFDYETPLCLAFNEFNYLRKPWLDNGIWKEPKPVKHTCRPFNYKTRCSEWPTCSWREDNYCNGGNFPGAYHIGNSLYYQDLEWYEALEDSELKDEALRNKAIMEGLSVMMNQDLGRKEISTNIGGEFTNMEILKPRKRNIDEYWWRIYKSGDLKVLESYNFKTVVQHNLANKLNMENLPSKYQGSFSF